MLWGLIVPWAIATEIIYLFGAWLFKDELYYNEVGLVPLKMASVIFGLIASAITSTIIKNITLNAVYLVAAIIGFVVINWLLGFLIVRWSDFFPEKKSRKKVKK